MLRASWWFPIALTFVAGVVGGLVFCVVGAIVGQGQLWGFSALRTVFVAALYGAVLAPPVFPIVRFALHADGPRPAGPLGGQGW